MIIIKVIKCRNLRESRRYKDKNPFYFHLTKRESRVKETDKVHFNFTLISVLIYINKRGPIDRISYYLHSDGFVWCSKPHQEIIISIPLIYSIPNIFFNFKYIKKRNKESVFTFRNGPMKDKLLRHKKVYIGKIIFNLYEWQQCLLTQSSAQPYIICFLPKLPWAL